MDETDIGFQPRPRCRLGRTLGEGGNPGRPFACLPGAAGAFLFLVGGRYVSVAEELHRRRRRRRRRRTRPLCRRRCCCCFSSFGRRGGLRSRNRLPKFIPKCRKVRLGSFVGASNLQFPVSSTGAHREVSFGRPLVLRVRLDESATREHQLAFQAIPVVPPAQQKGAFGVG